VQWALRRKRPVESTSGGKNYARRSRAAWPEIHWNRAVLKGMAPAIKLMIAGAVVGVLHNRLASYFGTATARGLGL